jgi:hypothetical protein
MTPNMLDFFVSHFLVGLRNLYLEILVLNFWAFFFSGDLMLLFLTTIFNIYVFIGSAETDNESFYQYMQNDHTTRPNINKAVIFLHAANRLV